MSILKIAKMGHPVLSRVAEAVADPLHPEVQRLIRDMIETMFDANGAGLAAPQVHVPLRVVVYHVPPGREDSADEPADGVPLSVLINPVLEPIGDEKVRGFEGCLSVPGLRGEVARHNHLRFQALNERGESVSAEVHGFHARVLQHECDHLDGILYPQRMDDLSRLVFESEIHHLLAEKPS